VSTFRRIALLTALGLLAAMPAFAQSPGIGGVVATSAASVSVVNTTTSTALFSFSIPPRFYANFAPSIQGGQYLHTRSLGSISTNPATGSVGTINMGCNFGTGASITMLNAAQMTQNLASTPIILDLWVRITGANAELIEGLLNIPGASPTSVNGGVTTTGPILTSAVNPSGTTVTGQVNTLACNWQWASGSTSNGITINHTIAVVGD
jgi:hypothetical protein